MKLFPFRMRLINKETEFFREEKKFMRRLLGLLLILIIVGVGTIYFVMGSSKAKLVEPVEIKKVSEDFVIHIRAEKIDQGFQVLRSLEYIGEESIKIMHRTPLISVSVDHDNHRFTGSPVAKTLEQGDVYYPQDPQTFSALEKGDHVLLVHAQFVIEGKEVNIKSEKAIRFN
jgi:flagellar basal body-associated protein FliL